MVLAVPTTQKPQAGLAWGFHKVLYGRIRVIGLYEVVVVQRLVCFVGCGFGIWKGTGASIRIELNLEESMTLGLDSRDEEQNWRTLALVSQNSGFDTCAGFLS